MASKKILTPELTKTLAQAHVLGVNKDDNRSVKVDVATAIADAVAGAVAGNGVIKDVNVSKDANTLKITLIKGDNTQEEKTVDLSGLVTVDVNVESGSFDPAQFRLTLRETDGSDVVVDLSNLKVTAEINDGVTTVKQGDNTVSTTYTPEKVRELIATAKQEAIDTANAEPKLRKYVNEQAYTANTPVTHTHGLGNSDIVVSVYENGEEVVADVFEITNTTFKVKSTIDSTLKVVAIG